MDTCKMTPLYINAERLWKDLHDLSTIGRDRRDQDPTDSRDRSCSGVSRVAYTRADMEARGWLLNRFSQAGLEATMDCVGNVVGRLNPRTPGDGGGDRGLPVKGAIAMGSHTDTVPSGGMFDGALGVLGALECVRTIIEGGLSLRHPVEVVSFANEEGGLFGSRARFLGISSEEWRSTLPVLYQAGLGPSLSPEGPESPPFPRPSSDYVGYLELHVEQGGILDANGEDIGVVQGIVCIHSFTVKFLGVANHAGTTPMYDRKDALLGASRMVLEIPRAVKELGSGASVGTCGQISVRPGGQNVIPGEAEMSIEVRDLDDTIARRIVSELRERACSIAAETGLGIRLSDVSEIPGALTHRVFQDAVEGSAREMGLVCRKMPSGASHDCVSAAKVMPAGMVFVPSKGGISHSPQEWTEKEQCANGANVLLRTLIRLDALLE
ncbi:MAG: Zn-dependent hydrolase [Bacillota bacterium]